MIKMAQMTAGNGNIPLKPETVFYEDTYFDYRNMYWNALKRGKYEEASRLHKIAIKHLKAIIAVERKAFHVAQD